MTEVIWEGRSLDDLAGIIHELDDNELADKALQRGVDSVLDALFANMEGRFLSDRFIGEEGSVQWVIHLRADRWVYSVSFVGDKCVATKGRNEGSLATLRIALPDFVRLIVLQEDGADAYMDGRLEIEGDIMYAEEMETWFWRE